MQQTLSVVGGGETTLPCTFTGVLTGCGLAYPGLSVVVTSNVDGTEIWSGTTNNVGQYFGSGQVPANLVTSVTISATVPDWAADRYDSPTRTWTASLQPGDYDPFDGVGGNFLPTHNIAADNDRYLCGGGTYYPISNHVLMGDTLYGAVEIIYGPDNVGSPSWNYVRTAAETGTLQLQYYWNMAGLSIYDPHLTEDGFGATYLYSMAPVTRTTDEHLPDNPIRQVFDIPTNARQFDHTTHEQTLFDVFYGGHGATITFTELDPV
ncbi:hypothetical protein ACYOEI_00020 [Singulisphaera rosea]